MAHHIVAIHIYDLHVFYGKSVLAVVLLEVDSEAGNTLTAAGHTGNLHTTGTQRTEVGDHTLHHPLHMAGGKNIVFIIGEVFPI